MAADIASDLDDWSTTEGSNLPIGATAVSTNLDDNLRMIQSVVRYLCARASVASATTADLSGTQAHFVTITGTTTITGLGTLTDGMWRVLRFAGALTFTHNATNLILPTSANITTAAGDVAWMLSEGSGNWRCLSYMRADGKPVNTSISVADGTVSAPGLAFENDANTGLYRIGADNLGVAVGGVKVADLTATTMTFGSATATAVTIQTPAAGSGIKLRTDQTDKVEVQNEDGSARYAYFGRYGCALTPGKNASNVGATVDIVAGDGGSGASTYLGGAVAMRAGSGYHSGGVKIYTQVNNRGSVLHGAGYALITLHAEDVDSNLDTGIQINPHCRMVSHFGDAPSISSGAGSGASIAGTANGFRITCGTSAGTTIVVNLPEDLPIAPYAIANYQNSTTSCRVSATSTTQVTITFGSAPSSGHIIDVLCFYHYRETHLA